MNDIMQDDLIGRLRRQSYEEPNPPCSDRSLLDRCDGHHDGFCYHDDARQSIIRQRYVGHCLTCRPERWQTILPDPVPDVVKMTDSHLRPDWDSYFFEIARIVSTRATCPRAQIGVVLVDKRHRIVSTGFNGAASGEPHCTDVGCWMYADHCVRARHAERNAVEAVREMAIKMYPDRFGPEEDFLALLDITPYVFGPRTVCSECASVMARAGIKREPICKSLDS